MIWYDIIWYYFVWYGMVWYGMMRYGTARYDMASYFIVYLSDETCLMGRGGGALVSIGLNRIVQFLCVRLTYGLLLVVLNRVTLPLPTVPYEIRLCFEQLLYCRNCVKSCMQPKQK